MRDDLLHLADVARALLERMGDPDAAYLEAAIRELAVSAANESNDV